MSRIVTPLVVAERIRKLRHAKKLSNSQLAKLLECSLRTVFRLQSRTNKCMPNLDTMVTLHQKLGVSVDYLLGLRDKRI